MVHYRSVSSPNQVIIYSLTYHFFIANSFGQWCTRPRPLMCVMYGAKWLKGRAGGRDLSPKFKGILGSSYPVAIKPPFQKRTLMLRGRKQTCPKFWVSGYKRMRFGPVYKVWVHTEKLHNRMNCSTSKDSTTLRPFNQLWWLWQLFHQATSLAWFGKSVYLVRWVRVQKRVSQLSPIHDMMRPGKT